MKKRVFCLLLALVLCLGLAAPAFAAGGFSDLTENKWYYSAVVEMAGLGYIRGYPDGSFRGEASMSLAEFVSLIAAFKGLDSGSRDGHWAGKQLAGAQSLDWLSKEDIAFCGGLNAQIPRQVAAKILTQALEIPLESDASVLLPFDDVYNISAAYLPYVAEAYREKLIVGDADGNFYPNRPITRGAGATLIYRALYADSPIGQYSKEEIIEYFLEVALKSEYSSSGAVGESIPAIKWQSPVYYSLSGPYTEEDLAKLEAMTARMNQVSGFPGIYPVQAGQQANLEIEFLSQSEMNSYPGHYIPGLQGYAHVSWFLPSFRISSGGIAYLTEMDQYTRNSVICEELIQAMGMLNDSEKYPDSIFYQYGSSVQWPSDLDWKIMELLYDPAIRPGMGEAECRQVLSRLIP